MKLIIKSAEPEEWRNYRKTEGAIYEAKQCLRESLYSKNGEIKSSHTDWGNEMNHILNLNKNILRKNRHSALKGVITQLKKGWKVSQVRKELEKWRNKESDGHYKPYCGIVISYLEKKLKRYE